MVSFYKRTDSYDFFFFNKKKTMFGIAMITQDSYKGAKKALSGPYFAKGVLSLEALYN